MLALEPENIEAKTLRSKVVGKYIGLAESALDNNNLDKAKGYIARAESVESGSEAVEAIRRRIASTQSQPEPEAVVSNATTSTQEQPQKSQVVEEAPAKSADVAAPPAGLQPRMVSIKGGCFEMGSPAHEEGHSDDERLHRVCVKDFAMGAHEVTFAQYDQYVQATGATRPDDQGWGRGNRPVIDVSWEDALGYSQWLSRETGKRYRLPTESEWEYAARGR